VTFNEILSQTIAMLHQHGRVSYRAMKRQFAIPDDYLEDLTDAILFAYPQVRDEEGRGLVWTGDTPMAPRGTEGAERAPAPLAYTPPYLAEKILTSRSALAGERKQVTVLFADLKDSTELIRGLDLEAAQQLLDPAIHCMMDAVHRFEGTVNQVLGDGIMALFGAPIAHEDHALRACYAALAMQAAMRSTTEDVRRLQGLELRMRVGLNSGEVVVRAIGNDLHMDYSAVGETTHLAARMEQLATPGSIRLTAATLRLVEGLVQVHALGLVPVKGLAEPLEVFELAGASGIRQRLQAAAVRGLTPLVGRQQELEALHQALAQAQTGHGQVVALVGEAGVGKSRLVHECVRSPRTQGWRVLESAAVSYGKATPYGPVIDMLKRYGQIEDHDDTRTIRAKMTRQALTLDETLQETLPALLALLDALPEDGPLLLLDPPQRRQRTLDGLKRLLLRESQVQPLLLVVEDVHWIDTETQALLDRLVDSLPTMRLLLLVNYRPEYQHSWGSKTYYTHVRLNPLPPASMEAFLRTLLGDDPSLTPLTPLLSACTAGNPFFLEESVRTLVELGVMDGTPGAYRLVKPLQGMQVPATVQAVLAARIDRLPPEEKRLLQIAAVIGTDVPFTLLRAIADVPEEGLHRSLAHLQTTEFLYETRLFPEPDYTFTHALTHEVAYSGLLQEQRRGLHARLVEVLEAVTGDRVAEGASGAQGLPAGRPGPDQVERLAQHALRGEVWDKAVTYCRQAGMKARDRMAFREAATCFDQALAALAHLPESPTRTALTIDLRLHLGVLHLLGEYGQALAHLDEAEVLAQALDDRARLGQVLVQKTFLLRMTANHTGAMTAGQQTLHLATELGDRAMQVAAGHRLGQAYFALGDLGQAAVLLRQNVAALEAGTPDPQRYYRIQARAWLALVLSFLGDFDAGRQHGEEALLLTAEENRVPAPVVYGCLGLLSLTKGDLEHAIRVLDQGLTLCRATDNQDWSRWIAAGLGHAYALTGRFAEGCALLEAALRDDLRTGALHAHADHLTRLSEACLLAGRHDEAVQHACQALALARQYQERGYEAHALHQVGAVHAHADPPEIAPAAAHYQQALALAEALGLRPLQAHCHRGLGLLPATIGQAERARSELTTAIAMYQSMAMTFWLPQTEAALVQVEGR
jgi:predicted ATPase/class 3 adenylate cyclase